MARRIEVELTSARDDGTWTWRAAGARQPKGELPGDLLYSGAKVGDVVKVEAEFHLDGIEVTIVFPPKAARSRPEVLEMVSRPLRDDELVTTRMSRREGGRGDERRGRPRREGPRREGDGGPPRREGGARRGAGDHDRPRRERPEVEARPKPKRLRPRRTHRDAVVAEVPDEYQPIAQRVLSGGIPEVRKALDEQNAAAKAEGKPEMAPGPILAIAEELLPRLRSAEWRDRADAALADLDELDLRDLRSVVVAADAGARDDETRAIAEQLREGLNRRIEADHSQWTTDLAEAVREGRVVRALRLSSRPVKAGAPLPQEVAATLAEMASAALAPDIAQDRWATVLDAVAYSPVRGAIIPAGIPAEPAPELREAVTKLADRVPHIAALFGIDPAEAARTRTRTRRARTRRPENEGPAGDRPAPGARPPAASSQHHPGDGSQFGSASTTPASSDQTEGSGRTGGGTGTDTGSSEQVPSDQADGASSSEPVAGDGGAATESADAGPAPVSEVELSPPGAETPPVEDDGTGVGISPADVSGPPDAEDGTAGEPAPSDPRSPASPAGATDHDSGPSPTDGEQHADPAGGTSTSGDGGSDSELIAPTGAPVADGIEEQPAT